MSCIVTFWTCPIVRARCVCVEFASWPSTAVWNTPTPLDAEFSSVYCLRLVETQIDITLKRNNFIVSCLMLYSFILYFSFAYKPQYCNVVIFDPQKLSESHRRLKFSITQLSRLLHCDGTSHCLKGPRFRSSLLFAT